MACFEIHASIRRAVGAGHFELVIAIIRDSHRNMACFEIHASIRRAVGAGHFELAIAIIWDSHRNMARFEIHASIRRAVRTGKRLRKKHRAQLRTAAPCWGRVFPKISEVKGGREGWLMVMAGIIIPRLERKPAEPITDISAEAELLRRIPIIGTASQDAGPILRGVQGLADKIYPGIYQVHPKPILFIDQKNKAAHKGIEYDPFSTFTRFINTSPRGCAITIALVVLWESSPGGKNVVEWMGEDMHANIVFLIHPSAGRGKAVR
ncbi:hypothetical protein R3P38DRAFT_2772134 [Favolaschia claudopus]|uniref:Uncharacterized protein n=1 Tax=Favolaschia claudopus TaxID=2862362 RepID=A0AAW0C6Z0_9AGAR